MKVKVTLQKIIFNYEKFFLSIYLKKKLFNKIKKLKIINFFKYQFKYPYLDIPSSVIIEGGVVLEENVHLKDNIIISGQIVIGRNTSIHDNSKLFGNISIGDNCLIAFNLFASTSKHNFKTNPSLPIIEQDMIYSQKKHIIINDDCWIGTNVVIMQGVTIGKGSIIGANTIVTKSIPPYSVVVSNNRIIKKRIDFRLPLKLDADNTEDIPYFYKGFFVLNYEKIRFGVSSGLLSKKSFELKMNTNSLEVNKKYTLLIGVKKYIANSLLFFKGKNYDIKDETTMLFIEVNKNDKLVFSLTESIIVKSAEIQEVL